MPKKSPKKPPAQVKKAAWRDPERQSLEDVASEWARSLPYVEECVRLLKFNHIIVVSHGSSGLPTTDHFIFDKAHWPFKGLTMNRVGLRPAVFVHLRKRSEFPNGYTWGPAAEIFIPTEETRRIKNEKSAPSLKQPEISMEGHSPWLLAALWVSTELYIKRKLVLNRGHRDQIKTLLEKEYRGQKWLTTKMKERITQMVNKNPHGGTPRIGL